MYISVYSHVCLLPASEELSLGNCNKQNLLFFVGNKYESLQTLILTHNLRDQRWLKYIDISTNINHIGRIKGYI